MKVAIRFLTVLLLASISTAFAGGTTKRRAKKAAIPTYTVVGLGSIGGSISRGNSIINDGSVAGFSFTTGNARRHATLWRPDDTPIDLGSLAGDDGYSSVVWPSKNNSGMIVGISQTTEDDPNDENWSCSPFLYGLAQNITGKTCVGVVWQNGTIRRLPTLGGPNGFAAGANDRGQITGWVETNVVDSNCVAPQKLQFLPVVWGPGHDQIRTLPLYADDSSGSATAINARGQAVGISGICDQAVGRKSAIHALLWDPDGTVTEIVGDNGGPYWDTPMAINDKGEVVGFVGIEGDINANRLRAFRWSKKAGFEYLQPLEGDPFSQALGLNNRGQTVGISCALGGAPCRAVLWQPDSTAAVNLNSRVPGFSGVLTNAQDINDDGHITGRAIIGGVRVTFIATPVE